MADLELIWRPLQIGATPVRHRIMVAPHGQAYGENHQPSDRMIAYFAERAKGGAALVGVEATSASRHLSGAQPGGATSGWRLTAWERRTIPAYARLAEAVHAHDCRIFVQLSTGGVNDVGRAWIDNWHPVRGPSRVPSPIMNETPVALAKADIEELTLDYGQSAANLAEAGIDGVEIHAAHGYLGMQFISPAFNKRTDAYGGSVANRCRFTIEAAEAIRSRVGSAMTVGMRLSFDEFIGEAGVTPELATEALDVLAATGLFDYFSISCGSWYSLHRTVPPMGSAPEAFLAPYAKRAKAVVGDRAKVFVAGRVLDLATAERVIADGAADMVAMVRAHLADPFLVTKAREGRQREIVRCAGTNECMAAPAKGRQVTCVVNPLAGREQLWGDGTLRQAAEPKRITVVGGGPAGMRVAGVAARRGHEVTLIERAARLGGHLDLLRRLPTRGDWQKVIEDLGVVLESNGVDVRLGLTVKVAARPSGEHAAGDSAPEDELSPTDAIHLTPGAGGPDAIVCATGATWDRTGFSAGRPDRETMPGADQPYVLDVATATRAALEDPGSLGSKVLILDDTGTYLPLGLAELLGQAGAQVEVLSRFPVIGDQVAGTQDLPWLLPRLAKLDVRLSPNHFIESIDGPRVDVYETLTRRHRPVEDVGAVVLAMLRSPEDALFRHLSDAGPIPTHCIGDAVAPRSVAEAIYEGEKLGRAL